MYLQHRKTFLGSFRDIYGYLITKILTRAQLRLFARSCGILVAKIAVHIGEAIYGTGQCALAEQFCLGLVSERKRQLERQEAGEEENRTSRLF